MEFSAEGLESFDKEFTGCAFHLRNFTPSVISFVFDIAAAGDMVIFNAQGEDTPESPLAILTHPHQLAQLPQGCASNPVFCGCARDLDRLLGMGFDDWSNFRDLVIGKPAGRP